MLAPVIDIDIYTDIDNDIVFWEIGKGGMRKGGDRKIKFVCVCLLCISVYLSYPPFSHPPFSVLPIMNSNY